MALRTTPDETPGPDEQPAEQDVRSFQDGSGRKVTVVKEGRLPVTEFLFDRAGGASPFGEDMSFPLPLGEVLYEHPSEVPAGNE